jgi:hypothetical protein
METAFVIKFIRGCRLPRFPAVHFYLSPWILNKQSKIKPQEVRFYLEMFDWRVMGFVSSFLMRLALHFALLKCQRTRQP